MKYIVKVALLFICCSTTFGQQINCDSLQREFNIQINKAKKENLDKAIIQQLESTKQQLMQLFCNGVVANTNTAEKINGSNTKLGAAQKTTIEKGSINTSFKAAHKITVKVFAGEGTNNQTETISYYINATGNTILLDNSCLPSNSSFIENTQEEDATFDGWLMESNGNNTFYSTGKEQGKIAFKQPVAQFMKLSNSNTTKPVIKALSKTKKIAGYTCTAYSVTAKENGETMQYTCWVTNTPLSFNHKSFPFFTMFSANTIGLPTAPNTAILLIEGTTGSEKIMVEVIGIQHTNKNVDFVGYKQMDIRK